MAEEGYTVTLNVYDLSQGLARQLSTTFLGKAIEGIWHTGVVVYGNEYYFGGGIQKETAGRTPYGTPLKVFKLGVTHVPQDVFEMYLDEISSRYTAETYSLLKHNCNNFSNEVAQFLVGASIPDYILQLPNEVMSSPMGSLILPMIQNLEATLRSGAVPQAPQFRPNLSSQQAQTGGAVSSGGQDLAKETKSGVKLEDEKPSLNSVPPAVEPRKEKEKASAVDPLGDARSKVQDEISREFAAIMAQGSLRASEAAALATRRVMQRYGSLNVGSPRS
ncbi:Desumoylating isopeptidase 1 [Linum perenne]